MSDTSLSDKLATLSPDQLATLRARLNQRSPSLSIQPRAQVSEIPEGVHIRLDGEDAWQATSTQARLWFLEQYLGPNPLYNIVRSLRLSGPLNFQALEQALKHIIHRHEALRTTFHNVEGIPYQVVHSHHDYPYSDFALKTIDLQGLPAAEKEFTFQQQLCDWGQQPFDLTQDCLLRVVLFQLDATDFGLLIVLHHMVGDGWSLNLFADELSQLYQAFMAGQPGPLPPVRLQFADYSLWLARQLQSEQPSEQQKEKRHYWQKQLSGPLPVLELPCDRPRGLHQTYQGSRAPIAISSETVAALKTLGRQVGASFFMVLLASFKVLLHRYTGQTDIIVGSPFANRSCPEVEGIMGYFVDNLPLRTDLSGSPSFLSLLKQVQKTSVEAYTQAYPFAEILNAIQATSGNGQSPVFSVMMGLQNTPTQNLELPNIQVASCAPDGLPPQSKAPLSSYRFSQDIQVARFELTLLLKEEQGHLLGVLEYNRDLFNADTIERLINHWYCLIQGILTNPHGSTHSSIGQLPLLSEAERHQLLVTWNDTQADYPQDKCIHQLFEAQVMRSPNAIAIDFDNKQLTYWALNTQANQLAHYLINAGIKPNALVGICLPPSIEMVVGMLAILKAGGAYVPIDPHYPQARITLMLEDAEIALLLSHTSLSHRFQNQKFQNQNFQQDSIRIIDLDRSEAWQNSDKSNLDTAVTAKSLAYVIYTSGSTGKPKGVAVPHHAVNRLVCNTNYIEIQPTDRIAQAANVSFDAATFEIWGALLNGARLVGIPKDILLSAQQFKARLHQKQISILFITTALFNQLASTSPEIFGSLRYLLFGGEAVDPKWVQVVLAEGKPEHLLHVYGPTENTTFTSYYEVNSISQHATTIPIGSPIANTQLYVLDSAQQPVPVGVPGELFIGGAGLAHSYLHRPDLTREKFVFHTFDHQKPTRLYRTGDLVRYLPNGQIVFIGRIDHQVKIRGFRIELSEIESVLSQHPQVKENIVVAREDYLGDKRLVAYLSAVAQIEPTAGELCHYLQDKLPNYMVPSAFVVLDQLPLTPNGKVNRQALPAPEPSQCNLNAAFVSPRTSIEKQLAQIWCQLLNLEKVGIHDNFFELGGHSLVAVQLAAEVHHVFQVELSLPILFKSPTILALSDFIKARIKAKQQPELCTVADKTRDWAYLVPLQTEGTKQPVFLIPGGGINENALIRLTRFTYYAGKNRPIYGLRVTQSLDGKPVIFESVQAMASAFIEEIRTLKPEGPYQLAGECLGGVVAFEIAQQLKQQGESVSNLVLLDTVAPTPARRRKFQERRRPSSLLRKVFRQISDLPPEQKLLYLLKTIKKAIARFVYSDITDYEARENHALVRHIKHTLAYEPSCFSGKITLLVSDRSAFEQPDLGWQAFTSHQMTIHTVPGDHQSYLEAYAKETAATISQCLD